MCVTVPRDDQKNGDWLFVYGTLMSGCDNPMAARLIAESESRVPARVLGRLYRIDWYPGLVPGADRHVTGEAVRLKQASSWDWLDRYEGCHADDPRPHEYRRAEIMCEVGADFGRKLRVQTYVYAMSVQDRALIPSGSWKDEVDDRR